MYTIYPLKMILSCIIAETLYNMSQVSICYYSARNSIIEVSICYYTARNSTIELYNFSLAITINSLTNN